MLSGRSAIVLRSWCSRSGRRAKARRPTSGLSESTKGGVQKSRKKRVALGVSTVLWRGPAFSPHGKENVCDMDQAPVLRKAKGIQVVVLRASNVPLASSWAIARSFHSNIVNTFRPNGLIYVLKNGRPNGLN